MPIIQDTSSLRGAGNGGGEYVGYFNTRVNFQLVDDSGTKSGKFSAMGGKGKGRSVPTDGNRFRTLINGTRVLENMDKWFIGHLWCDALQSMIALWDNPLLENSGWTESQTKEADYPATMVFVKYVIMTTMDRNPDGSIRISADGIPHFMHLANREEHPIVVATTLEQPLELTRSPLNYEMQDDDIPLFPFDPVTYEWLEHDPVTGEPAFPRAFLNRLGPNNEPEFTTMTCLKRLDPATGIYQTVL